jgi:hypothetical protein
MQFMSNGFNMLKVNGSSHVPCMLIVEKMAKKSLFYYSTLCK